MMYEASLVGLLKTILIIVVVYYGLKFLAKLFAPVLMNYAAKKMDEKVKEHFQNQHEQQTTQQQEPSKKKSSKQVGEYIDYEELD